MKITIESTSRIVQVQGDNGGLIPARVWEGHTDSGIAVHCLLTRIAALKTEDLSQFEAELVEQRPPTAIAEAFPARMVL